MNFDKIDDKKHLIFNENAMDVLNLMIEKGKKVDMIFTDPPYKITARGNGGNSGGMFQKKEVNNGKVFKTNDLEIEEFLDWLEPYIGTDGFIGYIRYEEWENPTLIYNDFDNDKILFKGVEATEIEQV